MNRKRIIGVLALLAILSGCGTKEDPSGYKWREEWDGPQQPDTPDTPGLPEIQGKPRYIWIDAAANFQYYANDAAYIEADCQRIAQMGFTDIIVDVRPTSGDVLFQSSVAPACTQAAAWINGKYRWVERTETFDYLGAFIGAGHRAGLRVNAAVNTMVGGYHASIGDVGMVYGHPERKAWCAVDNLAGKGLTNSLDDPETGPRFLDPANADVQQFLLTLLEELASYEGLDGIVLDRCRYDDYNLDAGYSDAALAAFTTYLGEAPAQWPVIPQGTTFLNTPTALQRHWLTFRCKTIRDFVAKAADKVHAANPDVRFGVYVGAWFSEYYRSGVNWTSPKYELAKNESTYKWATAAYQKTGFADLLDFIFLGAYAGTTGVHGSGEWTMEGFAKLGAKRLCGDVPFAAGPDIGNGTGFENGHQAALMPDIVNTMMANAGGLFVFDLCHVRMFDYWDAFEQAIHAYIDTI